MAALSKAIEEFIKALLEDQNGEVEVKRNELAMNFQCSPSQINYVLETRFQPKMGYYIESRRGGGGYIRIVQVSIQETENPLLRAASSIGDSMTAHASDLLLDQLLSLGQISNREYILSRAALEDRAYAEKGVDKNKLRATILRNMLLALVQGGPHA